MKKAYISPSNTVYTLSIQSNILTGSPDRELDTTLHGNPPKGYNPEENIFSRDASTDIWDQEW